LLLAGVRVVQTTAVAVAQVECCLVQLDLLLAQLTQLLLELEALLFLERKETMAILHPLLAVQHQYRQRAAEAVAGAVHPEQMAVLAVRAAAGVAALRLGMALLEL
jgi:hypothetical protein